MKDPETLEHVDEEPKSPVTPRTIHKSDPDEIPDPEEDEDYTTTRPIKP